MIFGDLWVSAHSRARATPTTPNFYRDAGDPNSGPHVSEADTLQAGSQLGFVNENLRGLCGSAVTQSPEQRLTPSSSQPWISVLKEPMVVSTSVSTPWTLISAVVELALLSSRTREAAGVSKPPTHPSL